MAQQIQDLEVVGKDVAGAELPAMITSQNTDKEFAVGTTWGRVLRLRRQNNSIFYDIGLDHGGSLFINGPANDAATHALTITGDGEVTIAGNLTVTGTVTESEMTEHAIETEPAASVAGSHVTDAVGGADHFGDNALRIAGEVFMPGASQFLSGNVGLGIAHNLAAGLAGLALIGTGTAPVLGVMAVLAVKLNSFTSAVRGRNLWEMGSERVVPAAD